MLRNPASCMNQPESCGSTEQASITRSQTAFACPICAPPAARADGSLRAWAHRAAQNKCRVVELTGRLLLDYGMDLKPPSRPRTGYELADITIASVQASALSVDRDVERGRWRGGVVDARARSSPITSCPSACRERVMKKHRAEEGDVGWGDCDQALERKARRHKPALTVLADKNEIVHSRS